MQKPKRSIFIFAAALIPGAGHVLLRQPQRGLMFIFFMIIFGWISFKLMPENASFIGRHIGGVFIWGMSIIDAYKINKNLNA